MKKLFILLIALACLGACEGDRHIHITNPPPDRPREPCTACLVDTIVDTVGDTTIVFIPCQGHDFEHSHETGDGEGHCHE